MSDIECPYCDNSQEAFDWQEFEEEEEIEETCESCGKEFIYHWYSVIHFSSPKIKPEERYA